MRNLKKWMLAAILICGTSVFMACSSNEDNPAPVPQPDLNLAEKIIGKWMVAELDGEACPTNLKAVVTFLSSTKASGSLSDFFSTSWNDQVEADVKIDGNKMTITAKEDEHTTHVLNVAVSSITDNDMVLSSDWTVLVDGKKAHQEIYGEERWVRVTEDYADAIVGTWEGQVTRDLGDDTNGVLHRWECKAGGTYAFYDNVDGEWVEAPHFLADYFVDGTLLCSRWQDTEDSEELREWWEIESIKDGVMKGKVLRLREDGTTYTATFEMTKVKDVTDYSKESSWFQIPEITKEFDTFYIFATEYINSSYDEGAPDFAPLDNAEMLEKTQSEFMGHASVYAESTNVFAPYYRQSGLKHEEECWLKTGDMLTALTGTPYTDITAALDYYFENYNNGRPFIIAGHSQGSALTKLCLMNYFKEHPEYYKRMVAAYVIGFAVTKEDLAANPHLKFATGESDTGVIISWNTEGKKSVEENAKNMVLMPNSISINPLNWKRDETYAPASENLGSLALNEETGLPEIVDLGVDAQVVLSRGVVLTNAEFDFSSIPESFIKIFGPECFHGQDYTFFYNNIKDNVAKRIAAYKTN